MKRIISLILCTSMILCSIPMLSISASGTKTSGGLHSISELNTDEVHPDSHRGETQYSTLELDYRRSYKIDNEDMIECGSMWYPRVKKLSNGQYILFFQDGRWGPNVYYTRSSDGIVWDEPTLLFASHLTYNDTYLRGYATCDAIELENGDIVVGAIFQATKKDDSSPSPSRWLMTEKGIVTKISKDGGDTWSEQQIVYHGRCWEPSFLQLPDGTVQMYFTHSGPKDAIYGSAMGSNVSSGVAMLTSSDNGQSWSPMALSYPYVAKRIVQQQIYEENGIQIFTDQMPVAVLLNDNKTILMAVESLLPDKSGHTISIIRSHDFFEQTLEENEYGPYDRDDFATSGAAPYIVQFPSGETVLSLFYKQKHTLYIGNETGTEFYYGSPYYPLIHQNVGMWGDMFVADSHTLIASASDTIVDPNATTNLNTTGIGISQLVLNHRINAKTTDVTLDANTADWASNTDALFVGSVSQAQVSIRCAHDESNIYFLLEHLDSDLRSNDKIELFVMADGSSEVYRITVNNQKITECVKITPSATSNFNGANAKFKLFGTLNDASADEGVVIELSLTKSIFGSTDTLRVYAKLYNTDANTQYECDTFDGVSENNKETWHKIYLSNAVSSTQSTSASSSVWDGESADISWYAKDPSAAEFEISSAQQLYALSILCGHYEKKASVNGDSRVYYDENYNVIFDPSRISSDTSFVAATKLVEKTIRITSDIDLGSKPFIPIGSTGSIQAALIDGGGHTIKNLYVNSSIAKHLTQPTQYYYGLFAAVAGNCTIQNLTLDNVVLDIDTPAAAKSVYAGAIVGFAASASSMTNCLVRSVTVKYDPELGFEPTGSMIGAVIGKYETTAVQSNVTVSGYDFQNPQHLDNYTTDESLVFGRIVKSTIKPNLKYCYVTRKSELTSKEWNGTDADIGWYVKNTSATHYQIYTPEQLYALSVLCASYDKAGSLLGDSKVYYDENYNIIFDIEKITEDTPYVMGTKLAGKTIQLTDNIDLANKPFLPIGSTGSLQASVFDGQGCTISNLYVDSSAAQHQTLKNQYYFGLFATTASSCKVQNLIIKDAFLNIDVGADAENVYCGIISAYAAQASTLTNCKLIGCTINYDPDVDFDPASCLIGAFIGKYGTTGANSKLVATNFDFIDAKSLSNYTTNLTRLFGGQSTTPRFTDSKVTMLMRRDYGDYDKDGSITGTDLTLLIRYLSGWTDVVDIYDITSDGKVSNRDAIKLIILLNDPTMP